MTDDSAGSAKKRPRTHRSRITNGSKLLPSVHPQSTWARVYRDTLDTLHSHLGGEDFASAPQLMHARYAAVLDTELIYQADKIGTARNNGKEPEPALLDLFCRLVNASRRECEALGWERTARDVTMSLADYIRVDEEPGQ